MQMSPRVCESLTMWSLPALQIPTLSSCPKHLLSQHFSQWRDVCASSHAAPLEWLLFLLPTSLPVLISFILQTSPQCHPVHSSVRGPAAPGCYWYAGTVSPSRSGHGPRSSYKHMYCIQTKTSALRRHPVCAWCSNHAQIIKEWYWGALSGHFTQTKSFKTMYQGT